jgi:hypothetical protein
MDKMEKEVEPQNYAEAMLRYRGLDDAAQMAASWKENLREVV